jgi:hypothetical protein
MDGSLHKFTGSAVAVDDNAILSLAMRSTLFDVIRWVLVPIIVLAAMKLFRKCFPAKKVAATRKGLDTSTLEERFLPLRSRIILGMIAVGAIFLLGTWQALTDISRYFAALDGPALFLFMPQTAIWWFFPGFGALALSWELTLQLWALFGDRVKVNLFSDWANQSSRFWGGHGRYAGMDSRKVLRWMALLIATPIGFFTVQALNMHAAIGPDTIRDCGYAFKPCSVYALADARRLTQIEGFATKNGQITKRAGIVIDFKDGRRWSSADWGNFKNSVDPAFVEFLITRTNLALGSAITEEDIPSLSNQEPNNSK